MTDSPRTLAALEQLERDMRPIRHRAEDCYELVLRRLTTLAMELERDLSECTAKHEQYVSDQRAYVSGLMAGADSLRETIKNRDVMLEALRVKALDAEALEEAARVSASYLESNADPSNPDDCDNWVLPVARNLREALAKNPNLPGSEKPAPSNEGAVPGGLGPAQVGEVFGWRAVDAPPEGHYISHPERPIFAWGGDRYRSQCYEFRLPPLPPSSQEGGTTEPLRLCHHGYDQHELCPLCNAPECRRA